MKSSGLRRLFTVEMQLPLSPEFLALCHCLDKPLSFPPSQAVPAPSLAVRGSLCG